MTSFGTSNMKYILYKECSVVRFELQQPEHRKQLNERWQQRTQKWFSSEIHVWMLLLILLYFSSNIQLCVCQTIRPFPALFNAAQYRTVLTEPSQGTCGIPERSAYCKSSIFSLSIDLCNQDFCVQQCPGRTEIPNFMNLLAQITAFSNCTFFDTINTRPGSALRSASVSFVNSGPTCFVTPSVTLDLSGTSEFTISLWIWQRKDNNGTIIQKVSRQTGDVVFELNACQSYLNFVYRSDIGMQTITFPDKIVPETWKYIAIQVYGTTLSFFQDGAGPQFSAAYTVTLVSKVNDIADSLVRVGLNFSGTSQFLGRLQDFHFYSATLTNREIVQDYSGLFPPVRVQSECRCPGSYPRIKPLQEHYCIKNGDSDYTNDHVLRLNAAAHPLEYVNDGDANSIWISDFMNQVNIVVDLGDDFQVFFVVLTFYSPLPMALDIQRKKDNSSLQWETWQQFAKDCPTYFGNVNNGPLPTPTATNCVKMEQSPPDYSKGNVTFNVLSQEPVARPGYSDFYHTPELFGFVKARQVRVCFQDHFFIINERHRYYGLYEFSVIARCDCFGHASSCNYTQLPYQCNCLPDSHTQGRQCNECQPLFNDKPFQRGDPGDGYECRPCECYNHASMCMYNITLDPFPNEHLIGGGGVCMNCQNNTEGRFCERCIRGYYRPIGKSKYAEDVCSLCNCSVRGLQNASSDCEQDGGQCLCKINVKGRQCNTCKVGFFNLTADKPAGCQDCKCDITGSLLGDISCSSDTGQCNCKPNVRGNKCESCQYGFYNLTASNKDGCQSCNCNPLGSTSQFCEPKTGQCVCKAHITSRQCNECEEGYWAFENGCVPCNCNSTGTKLPATCEKTTGQCPCKASVQGLKCSECKNETFGFGRSEDLGCIACACNTAGTVNGSMLCDKVSGDCVCKANVQGSSCNQCKSNTWGLSQQYETGCVSCDCDPTGTMLGDKLSPVSLSCHQNTGQCTCLTNRIGLKCDDCLSGYYVSKVLGGGCFDCVCHPKGTLPLTQCNTKTGQCECRGGGSGVTGISCDSCLLGYYGFDGKTGSCSWCDCSSAGSLNDTCNLFDGQCVCKMFTQGRRCDKCVTGSSVLDDANPYGCSKAPGQQPPPSYVPINSTALNLTWRSPDYPNGIIFQYKLYRNGTLIYTVAGDVRSVLDSDLYPYTMYSYVLEAFNAYGSVKSAAISFWTPAGAPYGLIILNVTNIRAKSASFSWIPPEFLNGPLYKYILYSQTDLNSTKVNHWEGQEISVSLTSLVPFTNYIFFLDSCTTGGCLRSQNVTFSTMSAVPEGMFSPVVMAVNSTTLNITWTPPAYPNGIIILYELWMRGAIGPDGFRNPVETRIFQSSGQYNPHPTKSQENALQPPETYYTLTGLMPYMLYDFQVLAENSAGKAASAWASGRTGPTSPLSTPAPVLIGLSPVSLNITWAAPRDYEARGVITIYRLYLQEPTNLTSNPFAPPYMWTVILETGPERSFYILGGLSPYSEYTVLVEACNSVACVNSSSSTKRTNEDIPDGLQIPLVNGLNSSTMLIVWKEPAFPNGPAPNYTLQKTVPALSYPPQVIQGTRFPGGGYYLFPPETIPPNVDFTGIQFWFRTKKREGLLLFAASEGQQDEFVALQFKAGRPWFLFDPQGCATWVTLDSNPNDDRIYTFNDGAWHNLTALRSGVIGELRVDTNFRGCASFATTTNDEGLRYNDNVWHQLIAWRDQKVAFISLDNVYTGSRTSSCAQGTIIGLNTGVYIGGLPTDFVIRRTSTDTRLQIIKQSFQGCIRDIQILQQKYPVEIWKMLVWNNAIHNELAFLNWEGCPINLDNGVHFMGQGYARFPPDSFQVGDTKKIEFGFRTQMHTGIIFFAYGGTGIYIYCALIHGTLQFEFANGILVTSVSFNRREVNFCNSQWYNIVLEKKGQMANITVKDVGTAVAGDPMVQMSVLTSSNFYVGGIPLGSEAYNYVLNNKLVMPIAAFGGCMRSIIFDDIYELLFVETVLEVVNMNMDGCPPYNSFPDQCKDDLITSIYNGSAIQYYDIGLISYTDYLYRVLAINSAGYGKSLWGYGRTKEGPPIGVTAPYEVKHYSGYLVNFKWLAPVSTAGLLTKFVLQAYNLDNTSIPPVEAVFTNTSKREGNLTDSVPYTNYSVKLLACTSGGCSQSPDGLLIQTLEEVPRQVPAPMGQSGPRYIYVTWKAPLAPNGLLTGYFLYMDGALIYQGASKAFNVTNGLREYTSYLFYLKACTQIGCTEGMPATLTTAQLRPTFVQAPVLTALGTSSVQVKWENPTQLNGVLERYLLYLSLEPGALGNVTYNSSDLFLDFVLRNLEAGKTYYIILSACTGGGCTISNQSNITTAEMAPELIAAPSVTSSSPSQLHVVWLVPRLPNGEIIRYDLFQNELIVYSGLKMFYDVGGLLPYSLNAFRIVACTRKGCGSSTVVQARTMESQPQGFITMDLRVDDARNVSVKWTLPEKPNGNMSFDVYFDGLYYIDPGSWNYSTYPDRRSLHRSQIYNQWVSIFPLIPMSSYMVQVNASNTVGFILTNAMTANLPPASPDGVKPPDLVSQTPQTVTAYWKPVGRENSVDAARYILQFREKITNSFVQDIFGPTTSFEYTKENLLAYTEYNFRIVAQNKNGATLSDWVIVTTKQDKPAGFNSPRVVGFGARYINLVWGSPVTPNGILSEYKVYQNGQYRESTEGNVTQLHVDRIMPYTLYIFVVEVCTLGGCTRSEPSATVRTMEDIPEGLAAPNAISLNPASVDLTWAPPTSKNGVISYYRLERRLSGKAEVTNVVSVNASDSQLKYVDVDPSLNPYSTYDYRLIASNGAGEGFSPWVTVTTMSSRPAGVMPPKIQIINPNGMNVSWEPPIQPNGRIEYYIVMLPEPRWEIYNLSTSFVVFNNLIAYTEYSVTVTACTDRGCTQSYPVNVRTYATVPEGQQPPVATPVSQTMISLLWQGPKLPNGPNIKFELLRILIRQPLDSTVNTSNESWKRVYAGTGTFYEDRGLPMYTTYRYRLTVYNDIGQMTSPPTPDISTFGGFPRRAAKVNATALSHIVVIVTWSTPNEIDLQGTVTLYTIRLNSDQQNNSIELNANFSSYSFQDLLPNTQYSATITITINGGAYINSDPVFVTTLDGAPDGIHAPMLSIVNETAIRVSWITPEKPNGEITGYSIYLNGGGKINTGLTMPGSYVITGLQPYTVYQIQLEVCTVFQCVKSENVLGCTLEALPQNLGTPKAFPLSPYEVNVMWTAPLQPNGIILRYDLWQKTIMQCSEIAAVTINPELTKCTYIQCGILQNLCGTTCYSGAKVCCEGILFSSRDSYQCCGQQYALMSNKSDVCCGGRFYPFLENHHCCNNRYELVLTSDVCCPDNQEDRVSIGKGDKCCGTIPYTSTGAQICCAGMLFERYKQQCCGGEIISDSMVCCGGDVQGVAYVPKQGWSCCGQHYVQDDITLCCISDTGVAKVHVYNSSTEKVLANEKCCGIETISNGLSCCNFAGYNPDTQYCADISSQQSGCGVSTICSLTQKDTAFCDMCDFDQHTYMCGSVSGYHSTTPTPSPPKPTDDCVVSVKKVYAGLNTDFLDEGLLPFSLYEYTVSAVNSAGITQSNFTRIKTLEASPQQLEAPKVTLDPKQLYMIFLAWRPPAMPNGEIVRFMLVRDGIELYRGLLLSFTDDTTILPYRSYSYTLTACTMAGCTSSPSVKVATAQAAPEGVSPPKMQALNETAVKITWSLPAIPNGIVQGYTINFVGRNNSSLYNTSQLSMTLYDLQPYTPYNAILTVCTQVACTKSTSVSIVMPESSPAGVLAPMVIVKNSTSVDVYWSAPTQPNGIIVFYGLVRSEHNSDVRIFLKEDFHAADYNLIPSRTYTYMITVGTQAGNTSSEASTITMPFNTPLEVPAPDNVTVISANQISVVWSPIPPRNGIVDQYRVLLNAGQQSEIDRGVGLNTYVNISGLMPFSEYEVRIQACLQGVQNGCGTGPGIVVKTLEDVPADMDAPVLNAIGPNIVEISWKQPKFPNGVITQYLVYYRQLSNLVFLLINRVNNSTFYIRHAGSELIPFTDYQYKVVASNLKGDVSSPWSVVTTKSAPPQDMLQPTVIVTGAYSIDLKWLPPTKPNGVIDTYQITYKNPISDPTAQHYANTIVVNGSVTQTSLSGLDPFSEYQLMIQVFNLAGGVSSNWTAFKTGQSSPSGLGIFDIEKISTGLSVILRWGPPVNSNGIIMMYRIYEEQSTVAVFQGLAREFELMRLKPYQKYSVQLEACTSAGCTKSIIQAFYTAETSPEGQAAPVVWVVSSRSAMITWTAPTSANGELTLYEVYRRTNTRLKKRSISNPVVVYSTKDTGSTNYSFTDTNLQPYLEYQYSIKASNSQGSTSSTWQSLFMDQAPPEGIQPPVVTLIPNQPNALLISWTVPHQPNGIIQSYHLQRNNSVPLSFMASDAKQYTDTGLTAYTFYSYRVTVCSGGGCATSMPTIARTLESAPLNVLVPDVVSVNSTVLRVSWQTPQITTGMISVYRLYMNDVIAYEGMSLKYVAVNLTPFTDYAFRLTACTSGGCAQSGEIIGKTDDDIPQNMLPITLYVMSSSSIEISWSEPQLPNGLIISYDVRRNGKLIYTDSLSISGSLKKTYTDYSLDAGTEYLYLVVARNRKGSVESPTAVAKTWSSSPSGFDLPKLVAISSTSIQVSWSVPRSPNGVIVNYTVFKDVDIVYSGGPTQMSYIVPGLQFWTVYTFRVQACTDRGCVLSTAATVRTLSSKPDVQAPPTLLALADNDGANAGVMIEWDPPQKPNGVIQRYNVYRRQVIEIPAGITYGSMVLVYNGSAELYTDNDLGLLSFTRYEYSVTAFNNVGSVSSLWAAVVTKESPPESVPAPAIDSITPITITVFITAPAKPNGVVRYYNVIVNGTLASSSINLNQTVGQTVPLLPHTFYIITVQACTAGGCKTSQGVIAQTGSAKPTGQQPVIVLSVNSTAVKLAWSSPSSPNGIITRYMLYQRSSCPPTVQPFQQTCIQGDPTSVYEGLLLEKIIYSLVPYTAYDFEIVPVNDAGHLDFPDWVRVETAPEVPHYIRYPLLQKNHSLVLIDWSSSFVLNGHLLQYSIVMADDTTVYSGVDNKYILSQLLSGENLVFKIRVVTLTGDAESPILVFDPDAVNNLGTTTQLVGSTGAQEIEPVFYKQIWFIVLVVVVGVLLLLIMLACCISNCHSSHPFVRERLPLKKHQQGQPNNFMADPRDGGLVERDSVNHSGRSNYNSRSVSNGITKQFAPSQGEQHLDLYKNSDMLFDDGVEMDDEDLIWDKHPDSGHVSNYDSASLNTSRFSIAKDQAVFTDSYL